MKKNRIIIILTFSLALFIIGATSAQNATQDPNVNRLLLQINQYLLSDKIDSDFTDSTNWQLSASTNQDLENAIDNNLSSRWTTRQTQRDGQFYQIDFSTIKTFDRLLLDTTQSNQDYPRTYTVLISEDGSDWQTIASDSPPQANQLEIVFNGQQQAQFLRIEQSGSSDSNWWSIHELDISLGEFPEPDPTDGLHPDITRVADIPPEAIMRNPGGESWKDSYSVGDRCYCDTTFDHNIGDILVDTPVGTLTVFEACELIGEGPGSEGRPIYNDVQCGNGPANDAGDEDYCPGRVDIGREGCPQIGPVWNFD